MTTGSRCRASVERPANADGAGITDNAAHEVIAAIPEAEKTVLLQRLVDGDPHVAAEVRSKVREAVAPAAGERRECRRTVADLRARAAAIRKERETAAAERREAERRRRAEQEEKARRVRLSALAARVFSSEANALPNRIHCAGCRPERPRGQSVP